jgi:aminopeptidase N
MGSLWLEKRHGRDAALRGLEADRAALALIEPETPGTGDGQPLAQAISPVYYRAKAAYVFWMLRDLAGDQALSAALRAYNSATAQGTPESRGSLEKLLKQPGASDLSWFFADWVDADKGLPDLSIAGVYPTSASAGNWLVAVNLANAGYVQAEIPLTVRSGSGSGVTAVTRRVRVPARSQTTERILIQGRPTEVQINDGSVPETQASVHLTSLDAASSGRQ